VTFLKTSRLLLSMVACAAVGAGAGLYAAQTSAPQPAKPHVATPAKDEDLAHLKALVEAAEKAAEADDLDTASDRTDEAEALIAGWPPEKLKRLEESALLERLKSVEDQFEEETATAESEDGLKMAEETVALTGPDLRAQLEQVKAAEQGAVFDFPIDLNDKVLSWVYDFTHGKRGFVEGGLSRATQFLPMARQIFLEEGVPQDLAYLALIESGFKNTARSRAKAVGMWQFIRSTGRLFGLDGNAWIEERRDPVKSCRASARYLRRLYESSGDWYLALGGYNAGPMTLERAGNALGTRNFWDMARSHYLRDETKNYVPKLLAAVLVGRFPERYGLDVIQMTPYAYETVAVDKMTSLSVLARFADTDVESLKELNPELLRATTPPGHYALRVPPGTSGATYRALARIPSGERLDFKSYVIRRGDTLAKVAARFKVNQADLLEANNLKSAQFHAGRRIQVPPPSIVPIDNQDLKPMTSGERVILEQPLAQLPPIAAAQPTEHPAETPSIGKEGEPPSSAQAKPVEPSASPAPKPVVHVVKAGETLFSIAERYGINVRDLKKWNRIKRNRIAVGQALKLKKT
jgi:membrane-bound lytic murein transglycosylase D